MYTVNKFFEIIVRRVAGTADVLVIGSFLDGFERIGLRVIRCVVIEPNVRDKAIAFDFEWAGIVFQPFDFEWEPLISCLSRQDLGLYLSPTLPTLLPTSDIPDRCTIGGLLHDYRNPPPTDYFRIFPTIRSILWP